MRKVFLRLICIRKSKENLKISYLMPTSAHPGHVNIPYSLGYRLLRICSDSDTLQIRLSELGEALKSWGYKERSIQEAFSRVKQISRSRALERVVREKEEQDRV